VETMGQGYIPAGLPRLRAAVADYLTKLGLPTSEARLLISGGGQQGLALLASLWLRPGDAVVVESPCYPGALDAFRSAGARLLSVPVDEDGVRTDLLRELVARTSPRLVYVTSSFNNPTGVMLSARRRRELAQLAEDFQLPVI